MVRRTAAAVTAIVASSAACGCGNGANHQRPASIRVRPATEAARRSITLPQSITIGYSVDRRPIRAISVGDPHARRVVLVVGVIHGNEQAGLAITRALVKARQIRGVALWVLPVLNPDGAAARTRQNAHGVDLNRNFPYKWQPLGARGDLQFSGPRALSEPEARAARRFILRIRPQISIWFHQPLALVDLSGGDPRIERRFARAVGEPALELPRYPGSAVGWENHRFPRTTAFVVELPPGKLPAPATDRFVRAIAKVAQAPE